jgi:diguanylate cyclase (GGDEF)-like protein
MLIAALSRSFGLLLLCLCLSAPTGQAATLRGAPLLQRFQPEDYNATPQHLALATDPSGRMYVGNVEGVLRYDGDTWELLPLPGKTEARDLAAGRDGRIYVASYDTFGWLTTGDDGAVHYQELLTAAGLKGPARAVGQVWQVLATGQGVYFRAESALHFISYDRRRIEHWPLPSTVRSFFADGDVLYARVAGVGVCRLVMGRLEPEPGGGRFADHALVGLVGHTGWRLLVSDEGFFRADAQGIAPLAGQPGRELGGMHPYDVLPLADGSLVIGTLDGEVFRYAADYRLLERINLGRYSVLALESDREGGLWAATEGDLVRMAMPSPWSFLGTEQGMRGSVSDFEWHDGALWVASTQGFLRIVTDPDGRTHADVPHHIDYEAYALLGTDSGLLMGYRNGLMVRDGQGAAGTRVLFSDDQEGVFELAASRSDPNRAYGLSERHLFVLSRDGGRWRIAQTLSLDGASASGLVESASDQVWFGDSRGGPQRWTLAADGSVLKREVFGAAQGLPLQADAGSVLFQLDGRIHVISGENGYRFDGQRFGADTGPPLTLVDRPRELQVATTPLGVYAYTSRQLWLRAKGQNEWHAVSLGSTRSAGFGKVRYNRDGKLRVSTWSGLLQFDASQPEPTPAPLQLGFEQVSADSPDGLTTIPMPVTSPAQPIEIPSGYRLHFRYSLVSMDSGLQFRYRIHGAMDDWSDWTDRDLRVRALTPGDYLLEVGARTRAGRAAGPVSYRYRVLPLWHQRWWVQALAALGLLGLVALAVQAVIRRRTQNFQEANRRLEVRIAERTSELEDVNRKLAELATEDALTGISNRRALEQGLQREWYRCLDQRRPLSVLMIDVDHFKRYNDAHGHLEGDVLLRAIAQRLITLHDPKRELMARYGGEEFALLLPGVHQDEAARRAETIRAQMHDNMPETTVSIGVSGFVPVIQAEPNSLLRRADAALYRAKRAGRNRVEVDAETPPSR